MIMYTSIEKNLKEAIDKGRVKFVEYRIPKELTEKGDIEEKVRRLVDGKK